MISLHSEHACICLIGYDDPGESPVAVDTSCGAARYTGGILTMSWQLQAVCAVNCSKVSENAQQDCSEVVKCSEGLHRSPAVPSLALHCN